MKLHQIDLNLLVVFDAVYREQSLTRASHKLGLSQPAVSHALSRLRDLLGDPLFTRNGRSMMPTARARNLIGAVRQALSALEQGLFPRDGFDPKTSQRRFHIAVRDTFELMWLPPLAHAVRAQAPFVSAVSARMAQPAALEAELSAGTLDLAIDLPVPVSNAIVQRELGQEGALCVIGRRAHPAFAKKLTLDRYLAASHIQVSSRRRGPGLEDLALRALGHRRNVALRCQSTLAAVHAALTTDLLLTLPQRVLDAIDVHTRHEHAKAPFPTQPIGIHMYWHTSAEDDPGHRWLRTLIAALAKKF